MLKAIVYSFLTGNTELMAEAVCEGAKASGADVSYREASSAD